MLTFFALLPWGKGDIQYVMCNKVLKSCTQTKFNDLIFDSDLLTRSQEQH